MRVDYNIILNYKRRNQISNKRIIYLPEFEQSSMQFVYAKSISIQEERNEVFKKSRKFQFSYKYFYTDLRYLEMDVVIFLCLLPRSFYLENK